MIIGRDRGFQGLSTKSDHDPSIQSQGYQMKGPELLVDHRSWTAGFSPALQNEMLQTVPSEARLLGGPAPRRPEFIRVGGRSPLRSRRDRRGRIQRTEVRPPVFSRRVSSGLNPPGSSEARIHSGGRSSTSPPLDQADSTFNVQRSDLQVGALELFQRSGFQSASQSVSRDDYRRRLCLLARAWGTETRTEFDRSRHFILVACRRGDSPSKSVGERAVREKPSRSTESQLCKTRRCFLGSGAS